METSSEIPVIKSIFKNLIGNYKLMDENEKREVFLEICSIIKKFETALKDNLDGQAR